MDDLYEERNRVAFPHALLQPGQDYTCTSSPASSLGPAHTGDAGREALHPWDPGVCHNTFPRCKNNERGKKEGGSKRAKGREVSNTAAPKESDSSALLPRNSLLK